MKSRFTHLKKENKVKWHTIIICFRKGTNLRFYLNINRLFHKYNKMYLSNRHNPKIMV